MTIKTFLASLVALLALGGLVLHQHLTQAPREPVAAPAAPTATVAVSAPSPTASSHASSPTTPSPTTPSQPSPTTGGLGEAQRIASAGVLAYTQYSYRDAGPASWMQRLDALSTPGFQGSLAETFTPGPSDRAYWRSEVVATRRETKTTVLSADKTDFLGTNTPTRLTFTVTYQTALKTKDLSEWTDPPSAMSQFVTVVKSHGHWLVDDIVSTEDRSGS